VTTTSVTSGQSSSGLTFNTGDSLLVSSGGSVFSMTLSGGATEIVYFSGAATSTTVSSGSSETVSSGGTTIGTVVASAGSQFVSFGGVASDSFVGDFGFQVVFAGGSAISSTVSAGLEYVSQGGIASDTTVNLEGVEIVSSGGVTFGTMVSRGGEQEAYNSGTLSGATLYSKGLQLVRSGGSAVSTTVNSGGTEWVSSGGIAFGTTVNAAGSAIVFSGGSISNATISGGDLSVWSGGSATGPVTFQGSGGVFTVGGTVLPTGTISNFVAGDTIDLSGLTWSAGGTVSLSSSTAGELVVNEGGSTYDLQLDPNQNYAGQTFNPTSDTSGGTEITIIPCFAPGTLIATPGGAVAVETLRAGDLVLTADRANMPVRWLGVQTVATRFADPLRLLPIRIRAGALGESLPGRDLLLSPGHAVLLENLLVQAGALVNGTSIVRETDVPERLRYYHVELDSHALLLAEGVAAESFLDGVEAVAFDNADTRIAREKPAELPYPRIKSHRQVPRALRERLSRAAPLPERPAA
jgi:autotransporter passenger strand-loop-strand repeat protein